MSEHSNTFARPPGREELSSSQATSTKWRLTPSCYDRDAVIFRARCPSRITPTLSRTQRARSAPMSSA
eukprot:6450533-Prymnesium_polylepis.1